jgi:ABC-2 type transport system ATP-binding protein
MTGLHISHLITDIYQDLSFELTEPGLYGIIGRNGIGKSTLFSLINGEIKFKSGQITAGRIAYIPDLDIFNRYLTANDYIKLLTSEERTTFENYLRKMGDQNYFNRRIGKYSLGMKELFAFLYVISLDSKIIILDELLDGLDERKRFAAYDLIKEISEEKIVLLTSHNLSEVFTCSDSVYLLSQSSIQLIPDLETAQKAMMG